MKVALLFGLFVCGCFATISPANWAEPKIAFSPSNACTKSISCFTYLLGNRITMKGFHSSNPISARDLQVYKPENLKVTFQSVARSFNSAFGTSCDFPDPHISMDSCLTYAHTSGNNDYNNGKCLENFLAQVDICVNEFLKIKVPN
jgi:hypothetical protein